MLLAGVDIRPELIDWVRLRVGEPTATTLQEALDSDRSVVTLDIDDRIRIIAALDDPPTDLARLRTTLLRDLEAFRQAGLI